MTTMPPVVLLRTGLVPLSACVLELGEHLRCCLPAVPCVHGRDRRRPHWYAWHLIDRALRRETAAGRP